MVEPTTPPAVATSLGDRLRQLRVSRFPSRQLTQGDVAQALSDARRVTVKTVSTWEKTATVPSRERLSAYALFFATERSLDPEPHLVPLDELSPSENKARQELETELFRLRGGHVGEAPSAHQSWRFDDGAPITVICSDLRQSDQIRLGPLSNVDNPNYTELYSYADLDGLVALLNHLHSSNPHAEIRRCRADDVTDDDLLNHLVVLGGIAWNPMTRDLDDQVDLPIRQVKSDDIHTGEVFEAKNGRNHTEPFKPRWRDGDPGTQGKPGVLLEDVAMLARVPNPYNGIRTLTYCNGIHSRGVLGAVRCLTDPKVRDDNERYLEETFPLSDRFAILMRVKVMGGRTVSPTLKSPGVVRFEWDGRPARESNQE